MISTVSVIRNSSHLRLNLDVFFMFSTISKSDIPNILWLLCKVQHVLTQIDVLPHLRVHQFVGLKFQVWISTADCPT